MTDSELIDALGGTYRVAEVCDVTPSAVSQWRDDGIPDARRQFLSLRYPRLVAYTPKAARDTGLTN
jgi:hypothetical protein